MRPKTLVTWGMWCLIGGATIALLAWLTRWQTAIVGGLSLFGGLVGSVLLLIALIRLCWAKIAHTVPPRANIFFFWAAIALLLQLTYLPLAQAWRNQAIKQAQAFAESLIPRIEAYQAQHGDYPPALEAVWSSDLALPALLDLHGNLPLPFDNRQFYVRRAASYGLQFYVPDGFIGFSYQYCCGAEGQWTVTD